MAPDSTDPMDVDVEPMVEDVVVNIMPCQNFRWKNARGQRRPTELSSKENWMPHWRLFKATVKW